MASLLGVALRAAGHRLAPVIVAAVIAGTAATAWAYWTTMRGGVFASGAPADAGAEERRANAVTAAMDSVTTARSVNDDFTVSLLLS